MGIGAGATRRTLILRKGLISLKETLETTKRRKSRKKVLKVLSTTKISSPRTLRMISLMMF